MVEHIPDRKGKKPVNYTFWRFSNGKVTKSGVRIVRAKGMPKIPRFQLRIPETRVPVKVDFWKKSACGLNL